MPDATRRPNVLLIIMDDLAWGDLARHGNPVIRTPHLDRLYDASTRLTQYRSGPLCSPARASLMTGRYHYRTGVVDTYIGRSMMHGDEITLAEILRDAGYRTGAFGKWHLGDNYPMRTIDQGFEQSVVHNGGGIGQPGDYEGNRYHDPVLHHNGVPEKYHGYCTDIFTDQTLAFIDRHHDEPIFAYLATNCPHSPFQIDDHWVQPYRDQGVPETHARVYGMVENIDMNVGRLLDRLDELGIADDTIVIFTSDHGPCGSASHDKKVRYNAGLRGIKGSMYDGGVKAPCLWRYTGDRGLPRQADDNAIAGPIDMLPTLAGFCGARVPDDRVIDGVDLSAAMRGGEHPDPDRYLFMQWHRGDAPNRGENCSVVSQRFKLVNQAELYDLQADPQEKHDIAADHPRIVEEMAHAYDAWFDGVSATRGYDPPRIIIDAAHENPSVLTRQDWRGPSRDPAREDAKGIGWSDLDVGYWELGIDHDTAAVIDVRLPAEAKGGRVTLRLNGDTHQAVADGGRARFENINLLSGDMRLEAWIDTADARYGARYVDVMPRS